MDFFFFMYVKDLFFLCLVCVWMKLNDILYNKIEGFIVLIVFVGIFYVVILLIDDNNIILSMVNSLNFDIMLIKGSDFVVVVNKVVDVLK